MPRTMRTILIAIIVAVVTVAAVAATVAATAIAATASATTPARVQTTDFDATLISEYHIQENGSTQVAHTFRITNNTPTVFIKQYALTTTEPGLEQVRIQQYDPNSNKPTHIIDPIITRQDQHTHISFEFPDTVVGEGKTRAFEVRYTHSDIATIAGSVLELHLPPLANTQSYSNQEIRVHVPSSFGEPTRAHPQPSSVALDDRGQTRTLVYRQADIVPEQPLSVWFGSEQLYRLGIRFLLENPSSSSALMQVALPPDTSFQELLYESLDPIPHSLQVDPDGNWIATYQVAAQAQLAVHAAISARITHAPNTRVPVAVPNAAHTQSDQYWPVNNSRIAGITSQFRSIKELYDFTVAELVYSSAAIDELEASAAAPKRLGALGALDAPNQAVCQEFSDLFITLARSRGVPARRITGHGYSQNEQLRPLSLERDILHAWAEYFDYDKQLWIPVDPTWEHTTRGIDYFSQFDLNHIVFAINGQSSTKPFPVGSYSNQQAETKDVEVHIAEAFPQTAFELTATTQPLRLLGIPIPGMHHITITNTTGRAWYTITADIVTKEGVALQRIALPTLLPYQTNTVPVLLAHTTGSSGGTGSSNSADESALRLYEDNTQTELTIQLGALSRAPKSVAWLVNSANIKPTTLVSLAVFAIFGLLLSGSVLVFRQKRSRRR